MAIDQESFNSRLYELLKVRGYDPVPKNSKNERSNPQQADVFEFTFKKADESYGKVWATIDKASQLKLYYDDEQAESPPGKTKGLAYDDSWSGFLKHLKQWTLSKQLDFYLQNSDRLGDDMRQRDYYKMKERMSEGYYPINRQTSYSDSVPNVKIIIQHDKKLDETDQRFRNIAKIFVENQEGERFVVPTKRPGIARVYGRHIAEGGTPYDERGLHISQLVEEFTKMAGFVRATKNGQFTESVEQLVNEGIKHHQSLKETLQKMQSHRGYNHYFESWTPTLMEDDNDPAIAEMFSTDAIDPRIESVLPILNKLNRQIVSEIAEVNELAAWAEELTEGESEERPYVCVHAKKGKHECKASSSYEAAKKAAEHWKLKSTAGIDAYVADKPISTASLEESSPQEPLITQMSADDLAEYIFPEVVGNPEGYAKAVAWVKKNRKEAEEAAHEISMDHDESDKLIEQGLLSDNEINKRVSAFIDSLEKRKDSDPVASIKERITLLKQFAKTTQDTAHRSNLAKEVKLLSSYIQSGQIPTTGNLSAYADAVSSAEKRLGKFGRGVLDKESEGPTRGQMTIGKALAGIAGAMGYGPGAVAEEQVDEFDMSGWEDNRPKKYTPKLVNSDTGDEIKLPATLKDFRGDPVEIVGFTPPHKPSSTGRVHTSTGQSYFPGVVNAKIVGHEFDDPDNLGEGLRDEFSSFLKDFKKQKGITGTIRPPGTPQQPKPAQAPAQAPATLSADEVDNLKAKLEALKQQFDPEYQRSDDYSYWSKQNSIAVEIRAIRERLRLSGEKTLEDVDPMAVGSWIGDADRIYHTEGEEALVNWLGTQGFDPLQWDEELERVAKEFNLDIENNRDELIFRVIQNIDENRKKIDESTNALKDILRLLK